MEHPDLTMQRELARVTALLAGVCQMIEDPEKTEWPDGLWSWWAEHKAEHIEH